MPAVPKSGNWNNRQTYGMAVTCLILGVAAGYFVHAPVEAGPKPAETAVASNPMSSPGALQMPSAADLKRMADKQVAPWLAQLEQDPKNPQLLAQVGHAYMAAQQFESARQYYERSVAIKPGSDVLNQLSFVYVKLGNLDKAIDTLHLAVALDPKNAGVLYNLGFYEWKGKADPKAAIDAWEKLLKVDPRNPKRAEVEQMIAQARKHLGIAPGTKTQKPAS